MDTTTGTSERVAGSIGRSPLFRGVIRLALLGLAIGAMWFAEDRYIAFSREAAQTFSFDNELWLTYGAALLLCGLAFGLAVWMPFGKVRFMPSRLAFAAIALIPFLKSYLLLIEMEGRYGLSNWWSTPRWFDDPAIIATSTALAGVAIAAGLRARD